MSSIGDRLKHAWSVWQGQDKEKNPFQTYGDYGVSYSPRQYSSRSGMAGNKTIVSSIYTRLAIDVASVLIQHVRLDENGRFQSVVNSGLNNCLTLEANIDQGARAFRQDMAMSLFDEGVIAIVPVDTTLDPSVSTAYDIQTMRVGKIVAWYPRHVRVSIYNDKAGRREEVTLPKETVGIVENPLYMVMNEPNSTLQRLLRKLSLLDVVDEASSSGKLDLIIQLPYVIKSEARKQQADQRRKDMEMQLKGSQYGIAYADGTEKITQLNRPAENNLMGQVQYLEELLYSQLGLTKAVFDGTADEAAMLNYYNRTIEPLLTAFAQEMKRKFLTKTARTQGQSIEFYPDPFNRVSMADIAEIADKFTRNEILSSNEVRGIMGIKPAQDTKADELRNKNIPAEATGAGPAAAPSSGPPAAEQDALVEQTLSSLEAEVDKLLGGGEVTDAKR